MVLADTCVWIEHFRQNQSDLAKGLTEGLILMHPWVFGELACGNLKNRKTILSNLKALPSAVLARDIDALVLIEDRRLWGWGIGWVDVHLLASALLSNCRFWTMDKKLGRAARDLGLS